MRIVMHARRVNIASIRLNMPPSEDLQDRSGHFFVKVNWWMYISRAGIRDHEVEYTEYW
jgi:hypothetical protein